jgi:hypothetical protein
MSQSSSKSSPQAPLATLFAPVASSSLWKDSDLAAILRHQLQSPLARPVDPTFEEILFDPAPDPDRLRQIKDFAKSLRDDPDSGVPSEICHVLYYAAIASAQFRTSERLTSLTPDAFARGLTWTLTLPWLTQSLKQLFQQALERQKQ